MAKLMSLLSLLILLSLVSTLAAAEPSSMAKHSQKRVFIEASCKGTKYPDLCLQCLARFANTNSTIETKAALTDASTCVDSLPGQRMSKTKATIKVKALNVAQVTSNALALFHNYAARYRAAARASHKP